MNVNDLPLEIRSGAMPDAAREALALGTVLALARRARLAGDAAELGFIAVNETHLLTPYRQAVLCHGSRVLALSGVAAPEANAPFVQWLARLAAAVRERDVAGPLRLEPAMLATADAAEWGDWLPAQVLWLPLAGTGGAEPMALLLARDEPFGEHEAALLAEWGEHWAAAWRSQAAQGAAAQWHRWSRWLSPRAWLAGGDAPATPWWRRRHVAVAAAVLVAACVPVRLTVLAPGELVPAHPSVIRAPLEGTVDRFFVQPNAPVKAGDKLFQLDLSALSAKLEVAQQAVVTAEAEYRQQAQLAVFDAKGKGQLALLEGRIAERRAEAVFLQDQLQRAQVVAPRDGIALLDDPTEWIGKPVVVGERVMTVADAHDVEVEAWLGQADAIELPPGSPVQLYLNARPLSPVTATLRYAAHEAVSRPDGSYAYRVRATLPAGSDGARVGLKGTAKLSGERVAAIYWVLRRPIASLRQMLGW